MKAQELRTKSLDELTKLLDKAKAELNDNRRSLAAGELPNPRVVSKNRKEIARLNTIITEVSQTKASKGDA
jgi:large subunit ribosomal protein L29